MTDQTSANCALLARIDELNETIRLRDARIAELEKQVAALRDAPTLRPMAGDE